LTVGFLKTKYLTNGDQWKEGNAFIETRAFDNIYKLPPIVFVSVNPLNVDLNPICHFLALLGAHPILHVSRIRVKKLYLRCAG
jgi:hypothetical protein